MDMQQLIAQIQEETESAYQRRADNLVYLKGIFRLLALLLQWKLRSGELVKKRTPGA